MWRPHQRLRLSASRGIGLIDALIALAILSFGLLALTRMQTRLVAQATEAQERITAVQRGDELLSTMLADDPLNANCYTLPAAGVCPAAGANARARTDAWALATAAALPGTVNAGTVLVADRMTLTITWTGKETQETRTHVAITDVR